MFPGTYCPQTAGGDFRAGEGSGKASDIDLFDSWYLHLFLWDAQAQSIVGAYRMGLADEILASRGKHGLYTQAFQIRSPRPANDESVD